MSSNSVRPVLFILLALALSVNALAQNDSIRDLQEVTVVADAEHKSNTTSSPTQIKTKIDIEKLPALQVSDVLKHLSGVNIKDYGGIGGLKTVSVRSLGAAHTAVSYDGITVADGQNGQIDISRFSLDNLSSLELVNGQSDGIFLPARSMASAALLVLNTVRPSFSNNRPVSGSVSFRGGSFTTLNPAFSLSARLSDKLSLNLNADYLFTKGNYKYLLEYGDAEGDSCSWEHRTNSDVHTAHAEATLFGMDSVQEGYVKLYYYNSERGLPGATIFYNTASFSSQRLEDQIGFVQGHYIRNFNQKWALQLNAKYNISYTHYTDPAYLGSAGIEENHYLQNEYYINVVGLYRPVRDLAISLAADGIVTTMDADLVDFARPTRGQLLAALSLKYTNWWLTLNGSALFNFVEDITQDSPDKIRRFKCSPFLSLSFKPIMDANFRLRVFYKNIYRLPTFNDLYYGRVGNRNLKPENTHQVNLGAEYLLDNSCSALPHLLLSADFYYNRVNDKIVAYPTKNVFTWTMLNYGKVDIMGFDLNAELSFSLGADCFIDFNAAYTFNRAVNVTDKSAPDYGHQIPYTPRLSGSGSIGFRSPYVNVCYSLIWSGARYAVNQNYAENRLPGYTDHSLSLSHEFKFHHGHSLNLMFEMLNLAGKNYAVIRYFPMPGRQFRGSIQYKF